MKHKSWNNNKENFTYIVAWLLVIAMPLFTVYISMITDTCGIYTYGNIVKVWRVIAIFFIAFLVHNYILAPLIIYNNKRKLYVLSLIVFFIGTTCLYFFLRPKITYHINGKSIDNSVIIQKKSKTYNTLTRHNIFINGDRPNQILFVSEPDAIAFLVFVLMIISNLYVKRFFKIKNEEKITYSLQKKILEQQLFFLKYQINPHFFMNTLNNIHALVDIDSEKAKTSIILLSKMMRYILYEGNNTMIILPKECEFICNYIELMRMRYTDKVRINFEFDENLSKAEIPHLLLMTFVENSFKHGISYKQENVIKISLHIIKGIIQFKCYNSVPKFVNKNIDNKRGGIGLKNAKQRLSLIYSDKYKLDINRSKTYFSIYLKLPLHGISNK